MKGVKIKCCGLPLMFLFLFNITDAQEIPLSDKTLRGDDKFKSFQFETLELDGYVLPYRFYQPEIEGKEKKYPLVVFFHGLGERGKDNRTQFKRFDPLPFWGTHPCYIVAPQCPDKSLWVDAKFGELSHHMQQNPTWPMKLSIDLLMEVIANKNVDASRVYVTGLSMGGYATWEILQRKGKLFAAAMPVCGGGDLNYVDEMLSTSLWVFHGEVDATVPVERSRNMVDSIRESGGNVKYTEYPGVDHDSWSSTYQNQEVWDWLFRQKKE